MAGDPRTCVLHKHLYQNVDIPMGLQAKVTYIRDLKVPTWKSQAYINELTGEGNDKHTDEYVKLEWRDDLDCWLATNKLGA